MNGNGFVLLVLLSFMWCVNTPVLTKDALPCFADSTSVIFSISIITVWKRKKHIQCVPWIFVDEQH